MGGGRLKAAQAALLSLVGIGTAHAQSQPDITIKTPAIQAIQENRPTQIPIEEGVRSLCFALAATQHGDI